MNILRLPAPLRRALLTKSTFTRSLTTSISSNDGLPTTTSHQPSLLTLSSSTLNSYTLSPPPTHHSLKRSRQFFDRSPPTLLFTAAHFRSFPPSPFPEICFLGRSNVGKSSLLNALLGQPRAKPAHVSKKPGKTRTMNGFGVGGEVVGKKGKVKEEKENGVDPLWKRYSMGGVVVVDMPGYGAASREEWGVEIMKYLMNRKQLRRTYILVDSEHGLKSTDLSLLLHLRQNGLSHQIVLSKVDKILYPNSKAPGAQSLHNRLLKLRETCDDIRDKLNQAAGQAGGRDDVMEDILCCSAEKSLGKEKNKRIGLEELRWSVLTACGLDNDGVMEDVKYNGRMETLIPDEKDFSHMLQAAQVH